MRNADKETYETEQLLDHMADIAEALRAIEASININTQWLRSSAGDLERIANNLPYAGKGAI